MNKTTKLYILFLFTSFVLNAQTYSTGMVTLSNTSSLEIQAKIDITATEVTLTLNGPADRWFAIGFGGNGMNSVTDAFIYESAQTFDKKIIPYNTPETDTNQDWTLVSDTVTGTKREVIATRALDTGENFDYVFSHSTNSIPVIWARGNGATMALAYHGSNKGATVLNPAILGVNEQQTISFVLYPNPAQNKLNIALDSNSNDIQYEIYSVLGNKVKFGNLNQSFNKININDLNSGIYLIKLIEDKNSFVVRKFVKK
jgi:hypothetical protein